MKTKEIFIKVLPFLLFFAGIIIGNKNIVHNEMYNFYGDAIKILALFILIFTQRIEISNLKKRIQELEDKN